MRLASLRVWPEHWLCRPLVWDLVDPMRPPLSHFGPKMSLTQHQYDVYENALEELLPSLVDSFITAHASEPDGMLRNACQYCGYKAYCHAKSDAEASTVLASYPVEPYNPLKER